MILQAILAIITPIAGKLISAYVEPKIMPVLDATRDIEKTFSNLSNDLKHDKLVSFVENTPPLLKFVNKCGWNLAELNIIIRFCVLIAKKPLTDKESRDKWDDNDIKAVFDFGRVIITKWIKMRK